MRVWGVNLRTGRPGPDAVRAAVERILDDPRFAVKAQRIGDAIAVAPGAPGLVDDIERLLAVRAAQR